MPKKTATKKEDQKPLLVITKNETEQVVVSRKSYKDKEYIDVRTFWKPNDKEEFIPTKKGASIPIEKAEKVAQRILKSLRLNPIPAKEEE